MYRQFQFIQKPGEMPGFCVSIVAETMEHEPPLFPPQGQPWQTDGPFLPPPPVQRPFYNRFLEAGREGKNGIGQYIATFFMTIGGYILGQIPLTILVMVAISNNYVSATDPELSSKMMNPEVLHEAPWVVLASQLFIFVVALLLLWVGVRFVHRKRFMSIVTSHQPFRVKRLFTGIFLWGGLLFGSLAVGMWLQPDVAQNVFSLPAFIPVLVVALLMLPIQTWYEEFFIRGWLLQGLGLATRSPMISLLLTSVLFASLHLFNPEAQAYGILAVLPQYLLPALMFGAITLLDEGQELSMGMHFVNNLFGTIIITSSNSAIQASTIWRTETTDMGMENIVYVVMMTITVAFLWWRFKWKADKLFRTY
jgi:uncharacterized protein